MIPELDWKHKEGRDIAHAYGFDYEVSPSYNRGDTFAVPYVAFVQSELGFSFVYKDARRDVCLYYCDLHHRNIAKHVKADHDLGFRRGYAQAIERYGQPPVEARD